MKKLLCAAALLCAAMTVHASDTSFFATVTDTDGQVWLNGTWNATLSLPSGPFGNQTPTIGGVAVPTKKKGIINAFGQIVTTLTDTISLDQPGGVWSVQACPNASTADYADTGCVTVKSSISGSTVDLTARFTGVAAPRFPAGPNAYGYSDIEVLTPSIPGEQYYNTGNNLLIAGLRIWDGKVWQGVGASGGGGAANPAGQDQDVQINKTVGEIKQFNADPGRFTYNNTTHMLKSNANGSLNPDLYSGTNGIATALASPECAGSCQVEQPITTTDTAAIPALSSDTPQVIDSQRNGSWMRFWHNPGYNNSSLLGGTAIGHYDYGVYDTPNPLSSSIVVYNPNHTSLQARFNGWGWNYGNAPSVQNHGWMQDNIFNLNGIANNQGIAQLLSAQLTKNATGDQGGVYITSLGDGGSPDYSSEGNNAITAKGGQSSSYFHGTVGTGASSGTTSLPVVYNAAYSPSAVNRNATSSGGMMLDTTQVILASSVTGAPASSGLGGSISTVPIKDTVTPSAAYGIINCSMPNNAGNPNLVNSIRCPIIAIHGTAAGGFVPGYAAIAGDFPEGVTITAVDPIGGTTQYVTISYTKPHGNGAVGNPILFQGSNVIGTQIVYDAPTASNNFKIPYHVFGAPDSTHIYVEQVFAAGQGAYTQYDTPVPLTALTKSGTTVTGTYQPNALGIFSKQPAGVVAGCSDSGLNGAATNISVDPMTLTMTFTEAAGGTGCANATIQMPESFRSFKLYPGAEVRGPGGVAAPANIPLEPNNVAWAAGDNIENAFHPFLKTGEGFLFHTSNNALSGNSQGISFTGSGTGVSGGYRFLSMSNGNPCTMFVGCGGALTAPTMIRIGGYGGNSPNSGLASMDEAPLNGAPVIRVGPPDSAVGGTTNLSPVNLVSVVSTPGNSGTFSFSPQYTSFMGPAFIAGGAGALGQGKFTGANYFVNGYMNDAPVSGAITFGNNFSNALVPMGLCDHYIPSSTEVTIGHCNPIAGTGFNTTDGKLNVGTFRSQGAATLGGVTIGLQAPNYNPAAVYSGTAGSTVRQYSYVAVSPLGIMGPVSTYTAINNTASTLTTSNKVTVTCPTSLQTNYPAGTTYAILAQGGVNLYRNLGVCALGSTVVDDGSITTFFTGPTLNANMYAAAGQFQVAAGGGIGFYKDNIGGPQDVFINRIGVNTLGIGTTSGSAHNARIDAGNITLDAATGGGTQCLHADNAGNITGTGADCGAGGGGGGSVTSFSASGPGSLFTTSVANSTTTPALSFTLTSAGPHAFFGNCSGTTGTPNYCQPSYADLGGSVPTWNQNTTGTATNLSGTPALPNGTTATTQSVGDNSTKIATTAFVLANAGGGSGITGLTNGYIPQATSSTAIGNSFIDYGVTNAGAYTSTKDIYSPTFHSTDTSGVGFGSVGAEGTAPSGVSGQDGMWADSTAHRWKMNNNNAGARFMVGQATAGTAGHIPVYDSSGVDLVDSGAAGVTASGTSCTITAITNGIITGATCTP